MKDDMVTYSKLANDTRRVSNSTMGTAAECTNCHLLPSVGLNLTNAEFIWGRVNSQQPVSRMFVYIIRHHRHFALSVQY